MATPSEINASCDPPQPKKSRWSGRYCAVGECNSSAGNGHSMHLFPSDPDTRKKWIRFVQTCRANFGPSFGTPNKNSYVCHLHFEPDCYPASYALLGSFQMKRNRILLPGAVPTIQKPHRLAVTTKFSTVITTTATVSNCQSASATCTTTTAALAAPVCSTSVLKGVNSVRGAYQKRERQRMIAEILSEACEETVPPAAEECCGDDHSHDHHDVAHASTSCQTDGSWQKGTMGRKTRKVQVHPKTAMKGVQCTLQGTPSVCTRATQCDLTLDESYNAEPVHLTEQELPCDIVESDEEEMEQEEYVPIESDTSEEVIEVERTTQHKLKPEASKTKYIVFEDNLMHLFRNCHHCGKPANSGIHYIKGSMVSVSQECPHCLVSWTWNSQPLIRDMPAGNLLMSASILFSGSLPRKALRFLQHMGVASISDNTFFSHQNAFLSPAVKAEWHSWQAHYLDRAKQSGQDLTLGGDGRADSPGHCAKYGTYTLLDLDFMKVVDIELVQSNEVGNSCRMEKEGLVRAVDFLEREGLHIGEIVTDRHTMIVKHIRENMKHTRHSIDVWHVGKGLKKKLSKENDCGQLSEWIKSIVNHLYWVAASTPQADGQLMSDKWLSLANHIHNKHRHEELTSFPACLHTPLQVGQRKKKWIQEGTKLSVKLLEILQSRQMKKDVRMLSTGPQTAAIEAFLLS